MIEASATALVKAPPPELFAFVSDATNEPRWHTDVLAVTVLGEGPPRIGSRYSWTLNFMGKRETIMEVVEFEPDRLEQYAARKGPMGLKPTITYEFAPDPGGTRFTRRVSMQPSGLSILMTPMMRSMVPKRNAEFVRNLAALFDRKP